MLNGQIWKDVDGNYIQAHGGCIINHNGKYYWYGENKGAANVPGKRRVDVIGVSCYSSYNLTDWKYEGLVLPAEPNDGNSVLHPSKVLERPKVLYNESNDEFFMYMHLDDATYAFASLGVAVSKSPTGPFKLIDVCRPSGYEVRDMTAFVDKNGKAYILHTQDKNATLGIAELTDDYKKFTGHHVGVMIDQYREAPALFENNGKYYMVTSGCTGFFPNSALLSSSDTVMGKWRLTEDPCVGENAKKTFNGQSAYIFKVDRTNYILLDHWQPYDLQNSGYSILPIKIEGSTPVIEWNSEWNGI